ncbi:DoxX family protein, partial [Klebsiella pneumoniae]|uniref:DoxX family protein n=1 Tax=Klebsiella pneumoniae TaxID=573 RepID=UPI002B1BDAD0
MSAANAKGDVGIRRDWRGLLAAQGLPGFIAYGVLVGEVVAPCLLILGVLTRPAALVLALDHPLIRHAVARAAAR